MKVILYKRAGSSCEFIGEDSEWIRSDSNAIIVSEPLDVEFVRISKDKYAEKMMAAFDDMEKAVRLELANKLAGIDQLRQEFMAISHQEAE